MFPSVVELDRLRANRAANQAARLPEKSQPLGDGTWPRKSAPFDTILPPPRVHYSMSNS
jgi:hypothetical protein